jgi:ABC-type nitrate/sulfonate/bicarbonate transport system substrate-binding protein
MRQLVLTIVVIASTALGCLAQSPSARSADAAPTTIKIGIPFPTNDTMSIFVAQDKGYLREENIDVDLISLATGDKITFALVGGSVDLAIYTPDWFIRADEKADSKLKIVLSGNSDLVYSLIAPNAVQGYADLKGKRIGVSTIKAADAYLVRKMLAAHGLGDSDYDLIPAGGSPERAAALRAGSLSATLITPPFDQRVIDEGGYKRIDLSSSVVSHYAWTSETVVDDWARAHRATLVAYMRAWIKGTRWLHDPKNGDEAIVLLARYLKLEDRDARRLYDIYFGPNSVTVGKDGQLDPAAYQALLNDMTDQGQIGPPAPPAAKFLDASYSEEARKTVH